MKKLALTFIVFALAMATQAASVRWYYGGGTRSKTKKDAGTFENTMYLIVGDTIKTQWKSVAEIAAAASGSGTYTQGRDSYNYTQTVQQKNPGVATGVKVGDRVYFVLVDHDGSSYMVDDEFYTLSASYVYDTDLGEEPKDPFKVFTMGSNYVEFGAIPEPSSGLLLLIGMAGLALRRRRA